MGIVGCHDIGQIPQVYAFLQAVIHVHGCGFAFQQRQERCIRIATTAVDPHLFHFVKQDDVIDQLGLLERIRIKSRAGFGIPLLRPQQGHGPAHAAAVQHVEPCVAQMGNPHGKTRLADTRRPIQ